MAVKVDSRLVAQPTRQDSIKALEKTETQGLQEKTTKLTGMCKASPKAPQVKAKGFKGVARFGKSAPKPASCPIDHSEGDYLGQTSLDIDPSEWNDAEPDYLGP